MSRAAAWARRHWLLLLIFAVALPGGLLLLAALRRPKSGGPIDAEPQGPTTVKSVLTNMIEGAKEQAKQLRAALKNDPLASRLLGVDYGLVTLKGPADVASEKARLEGLIKGNEDQISKAQHQYEVDHFGGQSQEQFRNYLDNLNAQMAAWSAELQGLGA